MIETSRPLLLLSNDDGFQAKGIQCLIETLRPIADLIVVAPDGPRSGSSAAITSVCPIQVKCLSNSDGLKLYCCSGTPTDCVKIALHAFVPRLPDMVIGGINHGDNSSVNVHYSGTMGVVIEGCLKGIPSVGFSLCNHDADADFQPTYPYIRRIVEEVLENGLPKGTCLNVNFPDTPKLKGVRVCRQTDGVWTQEYVPCNHPRGGAYFWMTGVYQNDEPEAEDTDHWALDHGYVAITPTKIDVTDYELKKQIESWNLHV